MIFSKQHMFSESQAVTTTAVSENIIDLGAAGTPLGAPTTIGQDIGKGRPIPILVQLDVAAGGTSPTLDVTLEIDDNEGFSSATVVDSAPQVAGGVAGQRVALFYIPEGTNERYVRLNYTTGGTFPTHTITAGIVLADTTS